MKTTNLLSATLLYGISDAFLLALGGFILLPLYTRNLTPEDFGGFVAVKTNTELLTYALQFGLISAVGRLYFDYRIQGMEYTYIFSILVLFGLLFACAAILALTVGEQFWSALSPAVPAIPYLWLALSIAVLNVLSALAAILLRVEERVWAFVGVQALTACVLTAATVYSLKIADLGLHGLILSLLLSAGCGAAALPILYGRKLVPSFDAEGMRRSIGFALPMLVGYLAYFFLNKISILILQRYVSIELMGSYGIVIQLALPLTVAANAFSKSLQPHIFKADESEARTTLRVSGRIYLSLLFPVVCFLAIFAKELFSLMAPPGYANGQDALVILSLGTFVYAGALFFDTALWYHKRPRMSVVLTLTGCVSSIVSGLLLIPRYGIVGAALSTTAGFSIVFLVSAMVTRRVLDIDYTIRFLAFLTIATLLSTGAELLERFSLSSVELLSMRALLFGISLVVARTTWSQT